MLADLCYLGKKCFSILFGEKKEEEEEEEKGGQISLLHMSSVLKWKEVLQLLRLHNWVERSRAGVT